MAELAELEIQVDSKQTRQAERDLDRFSKRAGTAGKAADRFGKDASAAAKRTKELANATRFLQGQVAAMAASLAGLAVVRDATRVFAQFEQAITTVGGVMRATSSQMAELSAQAQMLGATTRFSASQAAEAQLALARAGQNTQQVLSTLPSVLNLAAGAQLQLGEAAAFTTQTLAQFKLEAEDAGRVSDVFVGVANRANTDVRQLAEAMNYGGVVAGQLGNSLEETAAAIGVLANSGIQASSAGTNLRGILLRLSAPTGRVKEVIEELAKRSGQLPDAFDSTKQSISELARAFDRANASPKEMGEIFGRLNTAGALVLQTSVDSLDDLTHAANNAKGEAQELADVMNDTLMGSFLALRSAVEAIFISMGESRLGSALRATVDGLTIVAREIAGAESNAEDFSGAAQRMATIVSGLIAATKLGAAAWLGYKTQLLAVQIQAKLATIGVRGLQRALAATGIGLAVVLLGELAAALVFASDETDELTESTRDYSKVLESVEGDIRRVRGEQEKLNRVLTQSSGAIAESPAIQLQESARDLRKRLTELRDEIASVARGYDHDMVQAANHARDVSLAYHREVLKAERELHGTIISDLSIERKARAIAEADRQNFFALLKEEKKLEEELAEAREKGAEEGKTAVDEMARAYDRLEGFLNRLRVQESISVIPDDLDRNIVRTQIAFDELVDSLPDGVFQRLGVDLQTVHNELEDLLRAAANNDALHDLASEAEDAGARIERAFARATEGLAGARGGGPDSETLALSRELRAEYQALNDALQAQVELGQISSEEMMARLEAAQQSIDATVRMRQETTLLNEELARNAERHQAAEAATREFNEAVADVLNRTADEFPASLQEAGRAAREFEKQYKAAMRAVANDTTLSTKEAARQIDELKDKLDEVQAELQKQAIASAVGDLFEAVARKTIDAIGEIIKGERAMEAAAKAAQEAREKSQEQVIEASQIIIDENGRVAVVTTEQTRKAIEEQTNAAAEAQQAYADEQKKILEELGLAILELVFQMLILGPAIDALGSGISNLIGGGGGGFGFRDGGAFDTDGVQPFADGGILKSPAMFGIAGGGLGVAGEAGPEAILPVEPSGSGYAIGAEFGGRRSMLDLGRLSNGRLGVKMFQNGGLFDQTGTQETLPQPEQNSRAFPGQMDTGRRRPIVNVTVQSPTPESFRRSEAQLARVTRRALR